MIAPEFIPPAVFMGRALAGTNKWVYPVEFCPSCAENEARMNAAREAERVKRAQEAREEEIRESIAILMGGPKALTFTLDAYTAKTPSQAEAIQACRVFNPNRDNLYIWGPTGNGKTHLACAVGAEGIRNRRAVEFFKPGAFLRSLRMKEPKEQDRLFERYAGADIFILDDLGVGNSTDSSLSFFYELLDMRDMAERRGLLITSNLSLDALAVSMKDDRLPSRIAGMCRTIHVEGPDARIGRKP